MAYREWGGFAPIVNLSAGGEGSFFEGTLMGVRSYLDRRGETPKQKWMVTFQCESHRGCVAQVKTDQGYEDVDVSKGEEYTLSLGTVLQQKLDRVLKAPERYEGAKFRITFIGLGEQRIRGRKPAKLYRVEADTTLISADEVPPPEEGEGEGGE